MVFKILSVVVLFVACVNFAACQDCGTAGVCIAEYDDDCPEDRSNELPSCMQPQMSCDEPLQAPANISVQCYDTCVIGAPPPFSSSDPLQCCADSNLNQPLSQTVNPSYTLIRLYSPNAPGQENYRLNTLCNYNIQCPDTFDLHYVLVRHSIEPPSNSTGNCLDFLRLHFVATGQSVDADVCGDPTSRTVPGFVQNGFHGSSLNVEFRSNRIGTSSGFFLAAVCINPAPFRVARQAEVGFQQRSDCTLSQSLPMHRTGKKKRAIQPFDIESVFQMREKRSFQASWIRVTREGVVKYEDNVLIVERGGKILYKFLNMRVLQVYNRIEGYLTFYSSSTPQGRNFPGYGLLKIGFGIAYYIQTIVDPRFLLSEEENVIVSDLLGELFIRQAFNDERFYFRSPTAFKDPAINCEINELAELNMRSCTAVVRSAADFFMKTDPFQEYCRYSG